MSIVHSARAARSRRLRPRAAALGAVALAVGAGLLVASPAQAAERPVDGGAVSWGFKQSFRQYVGNQTAAIAPIGPLPMGQRITVTAPATFDAGGTPAVPGNTSTPNETLPYILPVTGGTFTDSTHFELQTAGGWAYHFPSHMFDLELSNLAVEVDGSTASITADVFHEVTGAFGEFVPGTYEGTGVAIASIANPSVSLTGDTLTFTGTGVTVTQAGAELLPQGPGEVMDDIRLTASLGTVAAPPTWSPQLSVSKATGFNPDGSQTVTVTGSGFDPNANLSTRLPVTAGQPSGVYVVFGRFADNWRPSAAGSGGRTVISQKWAMPQASKDQVGTQFPSQAAALVELTPAGTFTATLDVRPNDTATGSYGIYTYAGGGAVANAAQELFVPISFAGEGDLNVDVTVPEGPTDPGEPGDPGEFVWRVDGGVNAVSLGTASVTGDRFAAGGALAPIVVTDTRIGGPAWSVSAQVSDFTGTAGTFDGRHLGWAPAVTVAGAGAVAGASVPSGFAGGSGLKDSRTLGSAAAGHPLGTATLGAQLGLELPLSTPAGDYTGTLTVTAVS